MLVHLQVRRTRTTGLLLATLNPKLAHLLLAAYRPCPALLGPCSEMRWAPEAGHIPRGFCGATGGLEEVALILVCAEPGDPHMAERHVGRSPEEHLRSAYQYAYECYSSGKDLFHKNIRYILDLCWPGEALENHLRRVWMVDSVLCSARVECGPVTRTAWQECRRRYLEAQLALMPQALVVALGGKAFSRMRGIPDVVRAYAAAPPGCNYRGARASWNRIAELLRARAA